jgi:hypothetical protein
MGIIPNHVIPNHVRRNWHYTKSRYTNSRYTNSRYTKSRYTKSRYTKQGSAIFITYLSWDAYLELDSQWYYGVNKVGTYVSTRWMNSFITSMESIDIINWSNFFHMFRASLFIVRTFFVRVSNFSNKFKPSLFKLVEHNAKLILIKSKILIVCEIVSAGTAHKVPPVSARGLSHAQKRSGFKKTFWMEGVLWMGVITIFLMTFIFSSLGT